jgi:hypothetical protein
MCTSRTVLDQMFVISVLFQVHTNYNTFLLHQQDPGKYQRDTQDIHLLNLYHCIEYKLQRDMVCMHWLLLNCTDHNRKVPNMQCHQHSSLLQGIEYRLDCQYQNTQGYTKVPTHALCFS